MSTARKETPRSARGTPINNIMNGETITLRDIAKASTSITKKLFTTHRASNGRKDIGLVIRPFRDLAVGTAISSVYAFMPQPIRYPGVKLNIFQKAGDWAFMPTRKFGNFIANLVNIVHSKRQRQEYNVTEQISLTQTPDVKPTKYKTSQKQRILHAPEHAI